MNIQMGRGVAMGKVIWDFGGFIVTASTALMSADFPGLIEGSIT
jgi:hypothetical protein